MVRRRLLMALCGMVAGMALLSACGSGQRTATPVGDRLAATKIAGEGCAPSADPLASVLPALVRITTPPDASGAYAAGTGIIIDAGWVLTNQHVVAMAGSAPVSLTYLGDHHVAAGRVVAADADLDLALIASDTGDLPSIVWGDEGKLQPGALLFAVGYAGGTFQPQGLAGHFVGTQVDRSTGQAYIVSDVQLQHGDSGGPLLNRCGQVVGINTAREPGVDRGVYAGLSIPAYRVRDWAIRKRQSLAQ